MNTFKRPTWIVVLLTVLGLVLSITWGGSSSASYAAFPGQMGGKNG